MPTEPTPGQVDTAVAAGQASVAKSTSAFNKAVIGLLVVIAGLTATTLTAVRQIPTTTPPVTTTVPITLPPVPSTQPPVTTVPPTTVVPTTAPPTTAPPTTTVPPPAFPGASNTGVPAGVTLTPYTGPTTITTCGAVIDGKTINGGLDIRVGNGTHSASTPCVTIKNSLVNGTVDNSYAGRGFGPVVITDSEIAAPTPRTTDAVTLSQSNYYVWRSNIHGGRTNVHCDGYCELHDSWVHDNWYISGQHMGAFLDNGNYGNPIVLDHNTFRCNVTNASASDGKGGCSADVNFYGDFSAITNTRVTNNLIVANPADFYYCAMTGWAQPSKPFPTGTGNTWTGNVFQRGSNGKCGGTAPFGDTSTAPGNTWSGNRWDDGTPLPVTG